MINESLERVLGQIIEDNEYLESYACAGFQMDMVNHKINDMIEFNKNLMGYAVKSFKERFEKDELLYICMACFNSVITYDISPVELLACILIEFNKYDVSYNGDINYLVSKVQKLSHFEALLLYLLSKQTNKERQLILVN